MRSSEQAEGTEVAFLQMLQAHKLAGCCSLRVMLVHTAGQDPCELCPGAK